MLSACVVRVILTLIPPLIHIYLSDAASSLAATAGWRANWSHPGGRLAQLGRPARQCKSMRAMSAAPAQHSSLPKRSIVILRVKFAAPQIEAAQTRGGKQAD